MRQQHNQPVARNSAMLQDSCDACALLQTQHTCADIWQHLACRALMKLHGCFLRTFPALCCAEPPYCPNLHSLPPHANAASALTMLTMPNLPPVILLPAEQSPYLKSTSKSAQASTAVAAGLSSPRSPRGKTTTTTVGSVGNSGSYSRQQLGTLYNSSPDPVGRMKTSVASTTSKVCASCNLRTAGSFLRQTASKT